MALYAQSKSKKGTNVTPSQFHPYEKANSQPKKGDADKLLNQFKNF